MKRVILGVFEVWVLLTVVSMIFQHMKNGVYMLHGIEWFPLVDACIQVKESSGMEFLENIVLTLGCIIAPYISGIVIWTKYKDLVASILLTALYAVLLFMLCVLAVGIFDVLLEIGPELLISIALVGGLFSAPISIIFIVE